MTTKSKDHRIRLRDKLTGQVQLVSVERAQELQRQMLPPRLGVGPRYEQLHNPCEWASDDQSGVSRTAPSAKGR